MNELAKIGSIAPGKQADLVLLDRDVMAVPVEELRDTKVLWTMVGGTIVWSAAVDSTNMH
jgi:predicted amidohydrolase YtcJ